MNFVYPKYPQKTYSCGQIPTFAQFIHKRHPIYGQKPVPNTVHPQKTPYLWTKARPKQHASTNGTFAWTAATLCQSTSQPAASQAVNQQPANQSVSRSAGQPISTNYTRNRNPSITIAPTTKRSIRQ